MVRRARDFGTLFFLYSLFWQSLLLAQEEEIAAYIRKLSDKNWAIRHEAAVRLGEMGPNAYLATDALIKCLYDREKVVRSAAALALGNIGRQAYLAGPDLLVSLQDREGLVRASAAFALGEIGNREEFVISALTATLKDGDLAVREASAEALGKLAPQSSSAIFALINALGDPESDVKFQVAFSLDKVSEEAFAVAISDLRTNRESGARAYMAHHLSEEVCLAMAHLKEAMQNRDWFVRRTSVEAFSKIGTQAISALIVATEDEDSGVRFFAIKALMEINLELLVTMSVLMPRLEDPDEEVSQRTSKALVDLIPKVAAAIAAVDAHIAEQQWFVSKVAQQAHTQIAKQAIEVFLDALQDPKEEVRVYAAWALSTLPLPTAPLVGAITEALSDKSWRVRFYVLKALSAMGKDALPAVPRIEPLLNDKYKNIREAAKEALDNIQSSQK